LSCKLENNLPNKVWWNQVFSGEVADFKGEAERSEFSAGYLREGSNTKIDVAKGTFPDSGGLVNSPANKVVTMNFYTKACQHCEVPICVRECPTAAIYKDEETGVVDTYFEKCIGCDRCIATCPYDVRHHNMDEGYYNQNVGGQGINTHAYNVVEKCTFCNHRLVQGELPFCVEQCPHKARYFGNIDDSSSTVSLLLSSRMYKQLYPESGTNPSVYFLY
jgi:molybdopterin-containing oxidoreductase family iron-sulfur binding subunit